MGDDAEKTESEAALLELARVLARHRAELDELRERLERLERDASPRKIPWAPKA